MKVMQKIAASLLTAALVFSPLVVSAASRDDASPLVLQGNAKTTYMRQKAQEIFRAAHTTSFEAPVGWFHERLNINNVPVERLARLERSNSQRVLLQLHGGGYVLGLNDAYREQAVREAEKIDAREAYLVDYRLAPQNVYPAALQDAIAAYQGLLERGIQGKNILLVGDSAGGNLALELAIYLKTHHLEQPAAIVLASPWATMENSGMLSRKTNVDNDMILGKGTPLYKSVQDANYRGKLSRKDPRVSPLYADLSNLPPLLIQTGGHELFLTEDEKLAEKAAADGTEVTLTVYPLMPHDFALPYPQLQDSVQAIQEIADFANRHMH